MPQPEGREAPVAVIPDARTAEWAKAQNSSAHAA